ncbi:hypothetical protein Q8F55_001552 [Vanrija albida]|uniref:Uncharacterized protein n=1 Tax=Vanrija albida TaxID=181172 RepID=A0ABR3QGB6_9TREE
MTTPTPSTAALKRLRQLIAQMDQYRARDEPHGRSTAQESVRAEVVSSAASLAHWTWRRARAEEAVRAAADRVAEAQARLAAAEEVLAARRRERDAEVARAERAERAERATSNNVLAAKDVEAAPAMRDPAV